MAYEVEGTDQFEAWYGTLDAEAQESVDYAVGRLEEEGPLLRRPLADTLNGSRHANMKELRPTPTIRVFFAFDPRRVGILLVAGDKENDPRFYKRMLQIADDLYDEHLAEIAEEL